MPQDTTINRILLTNYFEASRGWKSDYQVAMLNTDGAIGTKPITLYQPLPFHSMVAAAATLPSLFNLLG
nr:hypothetical protein [Nitrosomonas sp.]